MILLDTNVVSEPLRPQPDSRAVPWLDAQVHETLYLSTITIAEMRFGIAALPAGRRRRILSERFEGEVMPLFHGRILAFDELAATAYARIRARARQRARALGDFDALIAAIADANGLTVASRDTGPFVVAGVPVINPFTP